LALQNNNVGADTAVTCVQTTQCVTPDDSLTIVSRRGLKQNIITWTQIVTIVTRDVRTAQYIGQQVNLGALEPQVIAFAFDSITQTTNTGVVVPFPVIAPISTVPNFNYPNPVADWSGNVQVLSPCRAANVANSCTGAAINKVSFYSGTAVITCVGYNCNQIQNTLTAQTSLYELTSAACASSATQTAANTCAYNVAQDAICWVLNQPSVSSVDTTAINNGLWNYQAPSIGSGIPQPWTVAPRNCPGGGSNKSLLLLLLLLLLLIPLALCCCLLLLCLLRRKKREGDVHFATFDPQAANLGHGHPGSIPALGLSPAF